MSKVPPHSLEAEEAILGGLLLEQEAWDQVVGLVSERDFYKPAHGKIFSTISELQQKNYPTDLVTVSTSLKEKDLLEQVGGMAYLAELVERTPSTAHISSYIQILKDKSTVRRLISESQKIIEKSYKQDFEDTQGFLNEAEAAIFSVGDVQRGNHFIDASELIKDSLKKLEELYGREGELVGVSSGFNELDNMTAGFEPSEFIIVAARPSMGKTAFSINIALHAALKEKKKVAFFSVEMSKEQMAIRMLANTSKIPLSHLRVGKLNNVAWPILINKAADLSDAPLYIDDTSGISPFEIHSKCRRLKSKQGLDLVIIDYLQLMGLKKSRIESREREVSEMSKQLKFMAKELKIPVIALAQLNRGVEGRSDRRPILSDLRESGSIEQDADIIMMLYREDYYNREAQRGSAEIIVGKQRNGPTGVVKLQWFPEYGVFENAIEEHLGPPSTAPTPSSSSVPNQLKNFANPPSPKKDGPLV